MTDIRKDDKDGKRAGEERPKVIAIMGPTAVGKTGLAMRLAEDLEAEIVSADSMQVCRFMEIGTAKPNQYDRQRIAHHLVDIIDPDEDFNAFRYGRLAGTVIEKLAQRRKPALLVGGTGLYLKAVLHGLFSGAPCDQRLRERLRQEAEADGGRSLYQRLVHIDPVAAQRVHPHDIFRIVRALEVWECSGKKVSALRQEHGFRERAFHSLKIGLRRPRSELYERVDRRVDAMMAQGFLAEVKGLLQRGYSPSLKSMQALGYRHLVGHLTTGVPLPEVLRTLKRDTRRYAKRQITWFGRDPEIHWFHPKEAKSITRLSRQFLDEAGFKSLPPRPRAADDPRALFT